MTLLGLVGGAAFGLIAPDRPTNRRPGCWYGRSPAPPTGPSNRSAPLPWERSGSWPPPMAWRNSCSGERAGPAPSMTSAARCGSRWSATPRRSRSPTGPVPPTGPGWGRSSSPSHTSPTGPGWRRPPETARAGTSRPPCGPSPTGSPACGPRWARRRSGRRPSADALSEEAAPYQARLAEVAAVHTTADAAGAVVQPATLPVAPSGPGPLAAAGVGALLGLAAGVTVASVRGSHRPPPAGAQRCRDATGGAGSGRGAPYPSGGPRRVGAGHVGPAGRPGGRGVPGVAGPDPGHGRPVGPQDRAGGQRDAGGRHHGHRRQPRRVDGHHRAPGGVVVGRPPLPRPAPLLRPRQRPRAVQRPRRRDGTVGGRPGTAGPRDPSGAGGRVGPGRTGRTPRVRPDADGARRAPRGVRRRGGGGATGAVGVGGADPGAHG